MANTGRKWGAWAFAKDSVGNDWNAKALADNGTEVSNTPISLDLKECCQIGIAAYEDNTGAIDGVVTVYILGTIDGTNYEETTIGNSFKFTFTPVQNDTVPIPFSISSKDFPDFKPAIKNEGGQEIAFTVKYRTADIPVAS